jgi:hypothetical protein
MLKHASMTAALLSCCMEVAAAQSQRMEFRELPKEVRDHALRIRDACREVIPEATRDGMQGIWVLDLKGDGSRDIIIDNEGLCGTHLAGVNCSNRGCDMMIYKESAKNQWRKIFQEHLYEKHLVIDWDHMRLQMLIASIYAGDPRCKPLRDVFYTSGKSCNLIVTYKNMRWNWSLIR